MFPITRHSPTQVLQEVSPERMAALDKIWKDGQYIQPLPYHTVRFMDNNERQFYCMQHGIYGIITTELLGWIQIKLGSSLQDTIEIGAGNGTLGRSLGIPMYDNCMQRDIPEVAAAYRLSKNMPIDYPDDIIKMDGLEAVKKIKPKVVLGSWITHRYDPSKHQLGGNMWGIDEIEMMRQGVKTYILIGNLKTHQNKPLLNWSGVKVRVFGKPWLISRSRHTKKDRIFIITRK